MTEATERRYRHVQVRVPGNEAEDWHAAARRQDLTLSQLVRRAMREVLGRAQGGEAGEAVARSGVTA